MIKTIIAIILYLVIGFIAAWAMYDESKINEMECGVPLLRDRQHKVENFIFMPIAWPLITFYCLFCKIFRP